MPRPVFIICAETGAVDKITSFASLFGIFEKINYRRAKEGEPQPAFKMMIVASWMRDPNENQEQEFENEFLIIVPPNGREISLGKGLFSFSPGIEFWRPIAKFESALPIDGSGVMQVVNRVRRSGADGEWISQSYPIIIEELPAPDRNEENATKPMRL